MIHLSNYTINKQKQKECFYKLNNLKNNLKEKNFKFSKILIYE